MQKMKLKLITIIVATAMAVAAAPVANAAHHHAKGGCKGEFMYMKGGKCMDARAKA
jgi:Spy/CpxP family protein refolding chaperone